MRTPYTAIELAILRCPLQWTNLFVAVHRPQVMFSARLTAAPTTFPAATLTFSSGTVIYGGTIPAGCTVYIGTAAGLRDKGTLRLRSDFTGASSGTLNVAYFGDKLINFAANDYLTLVEDYRPAAKYPRYNNGWYMDYAIPYGVGTTIENDNYGPLARLGPPAIGFIVGGHCKLHYVGERSAAYSPSNSISAYAWSFPNLSSSSAEGTTASPITIDYTTAIPDGQCHSLTVTENTTAKTHTGRRLTFVFERTGSNAPYSAAVVGSIQGGVQQGGYSATLRIVNTAASESDFPTGAHVVLFEEAYYADDAGAWYASDEISGALVLGYLVTGVTSGATGTIAQVETGYIKIKMISGEFIPGEMLDGYDLTLRIYAPNLGGNYPYRSNIVLDGWITTETVRKNPETGEIEFNVATLDAILRTIEGYPVALNNRSTTPTLTWEDSKRSTMNAITLHFVRWRSTISDIADVMFQEYGPPASNVIKYITIDKASLFDQLNEYWKSKILGWVACDLQGALYCEMDAVIDETVRAQVPTIWTVNKDLDLRDEMEIQPIIVKPNSQQVLYAVAYRSPLGSRSPGDPHAYQGFTQEITEGVSGPLVGGDITKPDQSTLNLWAGNLRAKANNVYPNILHPLAGNWRVDPVPQCYFVEAFASGDTLRGFTLTGQKWIPRALRMTFNTRAYALLTDLTADAETIGMGGVPIMLGEVQPPDDPPNPPPAAEPPPNILPSDAREIWFATSTAIYYSGDFNFGATSEPTYAAVAALPAGLTTLERFCTALDGSAIYIIAVVGSKRGLWKCANPKAGAPEWVKVLEHGDIEAGGMVVGSDSFLSMAPHGHIISFAFYTNQEGGFFHLAEYNGSTISSQTILPPDNRFYGRGVSYWGSNRWHPSWGKQYYCSNGVGVNMGYLGAYNESDGRSSTPWVSMFDGPIPWATPRVYYGFQDVYNPGETFKLLNINTQAVLYSTTNAVAGMTFARDMNVFPRGAYYGLEIDFVDGLGDFYQAADGVTLEKKTTAPWQMGVVEQAKLTGGGPLVWLAKAVAANNELIRVSNDSGVTWVAMTGNFWSVASGNQIFINLGLVF